jgi:MurNAc alpha-1-phosphate uridylyltransferase
MNVMILAAGRGERMRPLTDHTPKPLLQAGPLRLIEYLLFLLSASNFKNIIINAAYLQEQVIDILGDGKDYGVRIHYSLEPKNGGLESGGGIYNALPLLGDAPFLVVNGDIWTDYPFYQLTKKINGLAHLILVNNPSHHPQGDFHLTNENKVLAAGHPTLTFSGIGVYHPQLFKNCRPGKFRLAPLLRTAMAQGLVTGEYYQGEWQDIGTKERLAELDEFLRCGKEKQSSIAIPFTPHNLIE